MPNARKLAVRGVLLLLAIAVLAVAAVLGKAFWLSSRTIFDLLTENKKLKQAISSLTAESQIGYAKVLSQKSENGEMVTRLLFVETARDDPARRILEREYRIEGDVVYFDALIVKFSDQYVMDGKARSLYLWRRVYGESRPPERGFPIEEEGAEPERYKDLFRQLRLRDREMFWSEVWKLSNDPDRLRSAGIQAIYGLAVYKKLRPGLIYVFKISNTGQLYPETVPAL